MITEIKLLTAKIQEIYNDQDIKLAKALTYFINPPQEQDFNWQETGKEFLTSIILKIAVNEGISKFKDYDDEEFLKEHIPLDISNTITELANILHHHEYLKIIEKRITAAFLIIKIYEWMTWNYESRCLYGDNIFFSAAEIFDNCDIEVNLWGEKDEIWLIIINFLEEFGIKSISPFYSCKIYSEEFSFNFANLLNFFTSMSLLSNYGPDNLPVKATLLISLKTLTMDKVIFKSGLKLYDKDKNPIKSNGFFEKIILDKLNDLIINEG
jgi:hypothetical protein